MDTRTVMKPAATDPGSQQGKPAAQTRAAFLPIKKTALILAAVMASAALAWRLLAPPPLPMELATASMGPMQVSVGNQGQVRIHDKYVLAAPVAARLQRIALDDGDPVRRGRALVLNIVSNEKCGHNESLCRCWSLRRVSLLTKRVFI
jgi:hypothetical protein